MGADIHLVVEASDTEQFLHPREIAFFEWPRQSLLFAAMTNRNGRDGLIAARGFPEPASGMANFHYGLHVIDDDDMEAALAMLRLSNRRLKRRFSQAKVSRSST